MNQALFILLILACPVMMFLMMRGMHGASAQPAPLQSSLRERMDSGHQEARIAQLEQEVARLRHAEAADAEPDPAFVERLHDQVADQLAEARR